MAEPQKSYTPIWAIFIVLLLVMIGFGSPFFRIHFGTDPNVEPGKELPPAGCVNSQPVYTTTGERFRGEFTVRVREFPERSRSLADELSANLRSRRINNFVFQRPNYNTWVVAVGRYTTFQQAASMRDRLVEKGYEKADVYTPFDDLKAAIRHRPICGCYAPPP